MWCTNYQLITSSTSDIQIKTDRWICSGQVLCQVSWIIKNLLREFWGDVLMDIVWIYKTDANHDQARFSRRWFFAPDSRCKIIGFPIGRDIDLRAFLVESLTSVIYKKATITTVLPLEWLNFKHIVEGRIPDFTSRGGGGGGVECGEQSHVFLLSQDRWQHHLVGH